MEIGNSARVPKQMVKTEWAENPAERQRLNEAPIDKNIGEKLNSMAGLDTRKNYFQENKKLDKEAFLKMFLKQVKYQDPTKPADNEKVAQQMAMFSQLEQQMMTNKNLEKMISGQDNSHLMALNLMGKETSVDRATLHHEKSQPSPFTFKLPEEASTVKVKILNDAGEVVDEMDLGSRLQGDVEAKWLGNPESGRLAESGKYFYSVEANSVKGQPISVESKLSGKVTGISTSDGKTMIHVGDQKIDLLEVSLVKEATVEAPKSLNDGSGSALSDKNLVGTKSESNNPEASRINIPQMSIGSDVADELSEGKPRVEDLGELLNPVMPIFTR